MKLQIIAVFLTFFSLYSCTKEANFLKVRDTSLPNFGDVDSDKIFTSSDRELINRAEILTQLNQYYSSVWEAGDIWGGLLIAKGDDILFEKYRGYGKSGGQMPIGQDTPLHVASVSKTITAMATLKLIEANRLKLEDPVTKFFPDFPYSQVTVFTLLSQRSGLPKYEYFIEKIIPQSKEMSQKYLSNQDILNLLIRYKPELSKVTNTGFMYCNTNYALLALIIENITKKQFPQALKEMVFDPLEMSNTFVFQKKDTATAAHSFYQQGPRDFQLDRLDLIYGDKNVYTTPRDLLKFSNAMYSDKFLEPELMAKVFLPYSNEKPGINNYGLGFRMKIFDEKNKLVYHNGWWHGSNAVFGHLLNSKVTIIAIGNKFSRKVYSALALSSLFENFPYETEKLKSEVGEKDSIDIDSLAGSTQNFSE